METISAYGYNVTGNKTIIKEIKRMLSDHTIEINWYNFDNNDIFWSLNGRTGYYVGIDHNKKEVTLNKRK